MIEKKGGVFMDLVSAMQARHSVRKYTDQAIEPDQAQLLEARMEEINQQEGLNFRLILGEDQFFQRRIPSFGNFENVKNYFVLAGKKDLDPQKVGYWGEDLVLYAQSLGLNTCWVGFAKFFYKDLVLDPGQKVFCLISLGYGQDQGKSRPSKSLEDVARGSKPYPEWFIQGVQGALLAPTAMNQQKFTIHYHPDGEVDFKAGRGFFAKLDLGIVKYHFDLVTKDRGCQKK